jgi:hypothetical protein
VFVLYLKGLELHCGLHRAVSLEMAGNCVGIGLKCPSRPGKMLRLFEQLGASTAQPTVRHDVLQVLRMSLVGSADHVAYHSN